MVKEFDDNLEKQDFRITRTRTSLCNAFSELIKEKRIEDITINELCDKAMIRRATFYNHFNDKLDFISFYVRYLLNLTMMEFIKKDQDISAKQNPAEYLEFIFNGTVDLIVQEIHAVNTLIDSSIFQKYLEIFSEEIQRDIFLYLTNQMENGYPLDIPLKIVSSYCAGGIIYSLRYWLLNQNEVSPMDIKESYKKILERFF